MYRDNSFFYNVSVIAKFLFYLFIILSMLFVNNFMVLLLFLIFYNYCIRDIKYLIISVLSYLMFIIFNPFVIFLKLVLIIGSFIIFLKYLNIDSIRYLIEKLFYKNKNSKISYRFLYICYFFKYFKSNYNEYKDLYKGFGLNENKVFDIVKISYVKSKSDIKKLLNMYNNRFYNYYDRRTYMNKYDVTSFDVKVVLLSVILFFFVYTFWR